ncbi:N-acetylmannosamine-6-phosphate 2-epimerase [Actinomyces sp. ZJ308]|uniref:N-acetylmannosamine-6-phosphate 2-epimerase n=1 Tax=Actinomyces sp. ZJ308 TaxID=2708342 RepID=UPI0014233A3C|nr:N-acetylmannosamine-6-phosphate 2-epimerase [Actinomyces sp. ZJ308]
MIDIVEALRGRLIVSCQAYSGEPMLHPNTMVQIAQSVVRGGAAGVRLKGLEDLRLARPLLQVPIIGLVKVGQRGVYITPTLDDALAVAETGCDIVAIDGTRRPRPDGRSLRDTVTEVKRQFPDILLMADCGSLDDGLASQDAGADLVGTTLAGYTGERPTTEGPDLELVEEFSNRLSVPIIAEGRINNATQAALALDRGATAVTVGTAITHPASITRWFCDGMTQDLGKLSDSIG